MASLEDTGVHLPIRSGHNYAGIAGHDSARLHLGDNYVINQSGFNIRTRLSFSLRNLPDFVLRQTQTPMLPAMSSLLATIAVPRFVR
jgi:hypothetical protein